MADKKISELVALPASGFATDDLIPIVDTSAVETKQTSIADLDARYAASGVTQYTDELAQDAVGGILTDTATINFTYDDATPTITADVIDGSITNAKVATGIDAVKIADGSVTNTEFQYLGSVTSDLQAQIDGKSGTGHTHTSAAITDFSEAVDDRVAVLVTAGANISATYNDPAGTLTIAVSGVSLTGHTHVSTDITDFTEATQDVVGALLTDSSVIDFTYSDVGNTLTATVKALSIDDSMVASGISATKISGGAVSNTEFDFLDGVTSGIQAQIDGKSGTGHTHTSSAITDFTEAAQDAIGAMIVDTATIDLTYADGTPSLTASVIDGSITYAKMQTFGANTFIANNTTGAAAPTEQAYDHPATGVYSGSITWTGSVSPSGATTHVYAYEKTGKWATLTISLKYASAGTTLQGVAMELPAGVAAPMELSGNTAGSDRLWPGAGWIETTASSAAGAARCYIRRNSGDTAYEMFIQAGSGNHAFAEGTVRYMVQ